MKVLVTGGAGFLGRALLIERQKSGWPEEVTVYSRDETKFWQLHRRFPDVRHVIGDVRDYDTLLHAVTGHDLVIHAAALKFVDYAEVNVHETVSVNVVGSMNVAKAAVAAGIDRVVGISTDKAASPQTTYGATKLLMERLFSEANRWSDTRFVTVRYGNVVGSTGSVIPAFRHQLEDTGVMTLTDPLMTRFWLPPSMAVEMVRWALDVAHQLPGATFVYPCHSMKLPVLAAAVYRCFCLAQGSPDPGEDCAPPVKYIGARANEKTHELLIDQDEAQRTTQDPSGFIMQPPTSTFRRPFNDQMLAYGSESARKLSSTTMMEWIDEAERV